MSLIPLCKERSFSHTDVPEPWLYWQAHSSQAGPFFREVWLCSIMARLWLQYYRPNPYGGTSCQVKSLEKSICVPNRPVQELYGKCSFSEIQIVLRTRQWATSEKDHFASFKLPSIWLSPASSKSSTPGTMSLLETDTHECLFILFTGFSRQEWSGLLSLLEWTTFCQNSPPWPFRLGWP